MLPESTSAVFEWAKSHLIQTLISIAVLFVLSMVAPKIVATTVGFESEVTYSMTYSSTCDAFIPGIGRVSEKDCGTFYKLMVANSGKTKQPRIEVHLPDVELLHFQVITTDLVASAGASPEVKLKAEDAQTYVLEDVPPNILVTAHFSTLGLSAHKQFTEKRFHVTGAGEVLNIDPQLSVLGRALFAITTAFRL